MSMAESGNNIAGSRRTETSEATRRELVPTGVHAVMGMDIVDFSTLEDSIGLAVIGELMVIIRQALTFHGIAKDAYRWSPAGDGGYVTFRSDAACRKALDVALSIFERVNSTEFQLRAALHAGVVSEHEDIGRNSNIWGVGINMAARILSVAGTGQLLVSRQYHDLYFRDLGSPGTAPGTGLKTRDRGHYRFGEIHRRTVKHGAKVEVMNVCREGICVSCEEASVRRWQQIPHLWSETITQYKSIVSDAMHSGQPIAAIAAARYLLDLGEEQAAKTLCHALSNQEADPDCDYPPYRHPILSALPSSALLAVIRKLKPRPTRAHEVICAAGEPAASCFFLVTGKLVVEVPGHDRLHELNAGEIFGESGLWVPDAIRHATVTARNDGMVLEIPHGDFSDIVDARHGETRKVLESVIHSRMIANVWSSVDLFPGLADTVADNFSDLSADCLKIERGEELNLASDVYILFTGAVRPCCVGTKPIEIRAGGRFDQLAVAGVDLLDNALDGTAATVIEDGVAVKIPKETVRQLRAKHPRIQTAWFALCGLRLAQIGFGVPAAAALAQHA